MGLIHVFIRDESRQFEHLYLEVTEHTQSHDDQGNKGGYVICRAHDSIGKLKDYGLDSPTRGKGTSLELQKVTAVRRPALGEYQDGRVFTCLLNRLLSFLYLFHDLVSLYQCTTA